MLTLRSTGARLCDGLTRRDLLQAGGVGLLGLSLPGLLRAAEAQSFVAPGFGRAKRCVLLFLMGGPPQHDTWDPKPAAPVEIRGELSPINTTAPGIQFSELFPRLARHADKLTVVRSVTHNDSTHTTAGYSMLTGMDHPTPGSLKGPRPDDHPHFGAIVAQARGMESGLPPFIAMPEVVKDAAVNEVPGQRAGFLGRQFDPFPVRTNSERTALEAPTITLPVDVPAARLKDRRFLLEKLDRSFALVERDPQLAALDSHRQRAFAMLSSAEARRAFDLEREPTSVREAYGSHLFGQGCLIARRLLEAGVALVSVYWHYEGPDDSPVWDTHANNYPHLRNRLAPPTDLAVAALMKELSERGLLDDTLLICMGEFGRSPKINSGGGRDHWPQAQSILLAGAGLSGGRAYGASDRDGATPAENPVTPADLSATFLHLLGVRPDRTLYDPLGRPHPASRGEPIRGLIS